jgi:hypothetical protein
MGGASRLHPGEDTLSVSHFRPRSKKKPPGFGGDIMAGRSRRQEVIHQMPAAFIVIKG